MVSKGRLLVATVAALVICAGFSAGAALRILSISTFPEDTTTFPLTDRFRFAGPTLEVTIPAGGARVTLSASVPVKTTSGSGPESFFYDACYRKSGGTLKTFKDFGALTDVSGVATVIAVNTSTTLAKGSYRVGMCFDSTDTELTLDYISGWVMLTN